MNATTFHFKRLTEQDDVQSFDCGSNEWEIDISNFLKDDALTQQGRGLNVTWLCYSNDQLVGFMSLAASSIKVRIGLRERFGLAEVKYPDMPCLLIGRLGVNEAVQHQGIGNFIVNWIYGAALNSNIGIKFLTLHVDKRNTVGRHFWASQMFEEYNEDGKGSVVRMLYHLHPESN